MGGAAFGCSGVLVLDSGTRCARQLLQKTFSTGFDVPQFGHTIAEEVVPETAEDGLSRSPQLLQNLLPSRFSVPQFSQEIMSIRYKGGPSQ